MIAVSMNASDVIVDSLNDRPPLRTVCVRVVWRPSPTHDCCEWNVPANVGEQGIRVAGYVATRRHRVTSAGYGLCWVVIWADLRGRQPGVTERRGASPALSNWPCPRLSVETLVLSVSCVVIEARNLLGFNSGQCTSLSVRVEQSSLKSAIS